MSKMHYFVTNFQKSPSTGALRPQHPLTFDFDDLKLRNLAKLWLFKLIMTNRNIKNQLWRYLS